MEIITAFKKNATEEVRVTLKEYGGRQVIDFRAWIEPDEGKERIPTKKGLTLSVSCFPELKKAVEEVEKVLKEKELL